MAFVDGQAWFTADSIETDAPIAASAHVYEATDRFVIGMDGGESFAFVFDGTDWNSVAVDKPVSEWTPADCAIWEATYPTLDDGSWTLEGDDGGETDAPVDVVPTTAPTFDPALSAGLMGLSTTDHLIIA